MRACISAFEASDVDLSTDMEEEALAPFGLVEVLDKFHVATVTIQRACVQGNNRAVRDDIKSTCSL